MKNRYSLPLVAGILALVAAHPALAQSSYGTGVVLDVPQATGTITLDGNADEPDWAMAPTIDMTSHFDSGYFTCCGEQDVPDISSTAKVLWKDGVLYVYVESQDFEEFYFGQEGMPNNGEHFLVGVDLLHMGGERDGGFSGWVDNMPDLGPVAYKITGAYGNGSQGITANFGLGDETVSPVDSGWVAGSVFVDNTNFRWGVEMAINGSQITNGAQIGFNIGGAQAGPESAVEAGDGEANYAYYAWQVCADPGDDSSCQYAGGGVMSDAESFATLNLQTVVANEGGPAESGFALRSTGPNPFRSATSLGYDMARAGTVDLAVFDALGRRVATLDEGSRAPGVAPGRASTARRCRPASTSPACPSTARPSPRGASR